MGFCFSFFKPRANGHTAVKTGHTPCTRSTEGRCQRPWETSHPVGSWLPGGPSATKASQKGQPQTHNLCSCLRAPSARSRHLSQEEHRPTLQESTHWPRSPRAPETRGTEAPGSTPRHPDPLPWAGPQMVEASRLPQASPGSKGQGFR